MIYCCTNRCRHRNQVENPEKNDLCLCSRRAKERTYSGIIMPLWLIRTKICLYRPDRIFEAILGGGRNRDKVYLLDLKFFEWKLHVLVIIFIIKVVSPVVHRNKINEADFLIQCFVLRKMTNQGRDFQNLIQW